MELNDNQFLVPWNPKTMGQSGKPMSKKLMAPGNSEAPDWDKHYGKAFKWSFVPKENSSAGADYKSDQIGLIAPISPDFHKWKDAAGDPRVQKMKTTWNEDWKKIPSYKQNQITESIKHLNG